MLYTWIAGCKSRKSKQAEIEAVGNSSPKKNRQMNVDKRTENYCTSVVDSRKSYK